MRASGAAKAAKKWVRFLGELAIIVKSIAPMKMKELLKRALKHPELFTDGELQYFELVKRQRKLQKKQKKAEAKAAEAKANESEYLSWENPMAKSFQESFDEWKKDTRYEIGDDIGWEYSDALETGPTPAKRSSTTNHGTTHSE